MLFLLIILLSLLAAPAHIAGQRLADAQTQQLSTLGNLLCLVPYIGVALVILAAIAS